MGTLDVWRDKRTGEYVIKLWEELGYGVGKQSYSEHVPPDAKCGLFIPTIESIKAAKQFYEFVTTIDERYSVSLPIGKVSREKLVELLSKEKENFDSKIEEIESKIV
jgi:hypothetical protein